MKKRIIYAIFWAISSCLWAQSKLDAIPKAEVKVYYIPLAKQKAVDKMTWQDNYWIGESKAAVLSSLNQAFYNDVKISKNDGGDRDEFWVKGFGIGFHEKNPNYWYDIFMYNEPTGNYFLISQKYLIHPGSPIRQKLLDEVKYEIYSLGEKLTDQQAAALNKSVERKYYFNIQDSDNNFAITVKDGIIQEVNIGTSE